MTPGNCPCDCPDCREAQAQEEGSEGRQGGFEPVLLTVRSKSGRTLNPIAGGPVVSAAVWDQEDLDRRLAAAAADPDIEVSTRPLPRPEDYDPAADCDLCGKPLPPGYAGIAHADCIDAHEGSEGGAGRHFARPINGRNSPMTTGRSYQGGDFGRTLSGGGSAGDTTYTQQMGELTAIRQDAEEEVNSVRRKRMVNRLDILSGLGLDSASLSEAAAIDDALQAQEKAAQQTLDAADAAISGLKQRHGGIQEAVSSSPVDKPAAARVLPGLTGGDIMQRQAKRPVPRWQRGKQKPQASMPVHLRGRHAKALTRELIKAGQQQGEGREGRNRHRERHARPFGGVAVPPAPRAVRPAGRPGCRGSDPAAHRPPAAVRQPRRSRRPGPDGAAHPAPVRVRPPRRRRVGCLHCLVAARLRHLRVRACPSRRCWRSPGLRSPPCGSGSTAGVPPPKEKTETAAADIVTWDRLTQRRKWAGQLTSPAGHPRRPEIADRASTASKPTSGR